MAFLLVDRERLSTDRDVGPERRVSLRGSETGSSSVSVRETVESGRE